MSASVTTLLAAILAVAGTLTSPVLAQRYANRARLQEIESARQQRLDDHEEERRRTSLLERRQCYTSLHTAAWDFRRGLKNCLFDQDDSDYLEGTRQAYLASYRNSQMICSDAVLRAAVPAYDELTNAYGRVRQFLMTASGQPDLPQAARQERADLQRTLNTRVEQAIRHMRTAMRLDLGVTGEHHDAPSHPDAEQESTRV